MPARDAQALEKAMQSAMQTSVAERVSMGKRARERIVSRFERNAHWQRMVKFYHELLENKSPV